MALSVVPDFLTYIAAGVSDVARTHYHDRRKGRGGNWR
jgi:hypothetical protein